MKISPVPGKPAEQDKFLNIPDPLTAYYTRVSDSHITGQRVEFGSFYDRGS